MFAKPNASTVAQSKTPTVEANMSFELYFPRLFRCLAASTAAIVVGALSASSAQAERSIEAASSGCHTQAAAEYRVPARVPAPASCEEQVLASRGTGEPAPPKPTDADPLPGLVASVRDAPRAAPTAANDGIYVNPSTGFAAVNSQPDEPRAALGDSASSTGFDWTSAAIGAVTAAGLLALASLAAIAVGRRNRLRTAR
jgi:hypothetical protein